MSVTIELDFTGHTPAGAGIGYLETGLHSAKILDFRVYFNYNAPTMGATGRPVEGSYPDYRYVNENYFNQMKKSLAEPAPDNFKMAEEAPAKAPAKASTNNGKAAPVAKPPTSDEFEFLLD